MTQYSYYWPAVTGDGILEPYSADVWSLWWRRLFTSFDPYEGIVFDYENELEVQGITDATVQVGKGAALVDGTLYHLTTDKLVLLDYPTVNPRIDVIMLRKRWNTATIRLHVEQGAEAGVPTPPAYPTNTSGTNWYIPLARVQIATDGTLSNLTDLRQKATSPLMKLGSSLGPWELYSTTTAPGGTPTLSIPLEPSPPFGTGRIGYMFIGWLRTETGGTGYTNCDIQPNGNTTTSQYHRVETVRFASASWNAGRSAGAPVPWIGVPDDGYPAGHMMFFKMTVYPHVVGTFKRQLFRLESGMFTGLVTTADMQAKMIHGMVSTAR